LVFWDEGGDTMAGIVDTVRSNDFLVFPFDTAPTKFQKITLPKSPTVVGCDILQKWKSPILNSIDKDKIVMWIQTAQNGLPPGTKVVRLLRKGMANGTVKCLFWEASSSTYKVTDFYENTLTINNVIPSNEMQLVFENEIKHTLARAKFRNNALDGLISVITNAIPPNITVANYQSFLQNYNERVKVDKTNKVATIERLVNAIKSVYNPIFTITIGNDQIPTSFFDLTLILPLSEEWFEMDKNTENPIIYNRYISHWQGEYFGILNNFSGDLLSSSGAVDNQLEMFHSLKEEIIWLKEHLQGSIQSDTPEAQWLLTFDINRIQVELPYDTEHIVTGNKGQIKKVIFIHRGSWEYTLEPFAEDSIPLQLSFGIFRNSPLLSILLHELDQSGKPNLYQGSVDDTHIHWNWEGDQYHPVQKTTIDFSTNIQAGLLSLSQEDEAIYEKIDRLYMSDRAISLLSLGIILL
jgi:hypothetical protein